MNNLKVHDELNPKLWDGYNLRPEVHDGIITIVKKFLQYSSVELNIADIRIVGSNASYNYNSNSDIDVHIISNFELINSKNPELIQIIVNLEKTSFNSNYNIKIHGYHVEVYVEDMLSTVVSNGVYSVAENRWIKKPIKLSNIKTKNISHSIDKWKEIINNELQNGTIKSISNVINRLYLIRKNSISIQGEFGEGNLLFKELRNCEYLDKLKDKIRELTSEELSLESLKNEDFEGSIVNPRRYKF